MEVPFQKLTLERQVQLIHEDGVFLESIDYYGCKVQIHSLGTKFIEVYYSPVSNEIEKIQEVDSDGLKKYLLGINVS